MSHETRLALREISMSPDTLAALDEIAIMLVEIDDGAPLDLDVYDAADRGLVSLVSVDSIAY